MILFLSFFWIFLYREMMWKDKRKAFKNSIYSYLKLTFLYICMPSIHGSWHRFALLYFEMRSALHLLCRDSSLHFRDWKERTFQRICHVGKSVNLGTIYQFPIDLFYCCLAEAYLEFSTFQFKSRDLKLNIRLFCFKFPLQ